MLFNKHSDLEGKHAFLSPSNYSWVGYDDVRLATRFVAVSAAVRGTDLHALAHEAIRLGVTIAETEGNLAIANYVNDALRMKLLSEQPLYYSPNCFGTPDSIRFRDGVLTIHDLKTGVMKASFRQLEIYAAIFCLEYGVSPFEIQIELRIYQQDEIRELFPSAEEIDHIMNRIVELDMKINSLRESENN